MLTAESIAIEHVNSYHRDFSSFMESEKIPYSMKFIILFLYKRYFLKEKYDCEFLTSSSNFDATSSKLTWGRFHPFVKYILSYNYESVLPDDENCKEFLNLFQHDNFQIKIIAAKHQIDSTKHIVFISNSFLNIARDLQFELEENDDILDYCEIFICNEKKTQFRIGKTSQKRKTRSSSIDIEKPDENVEKMYRNFTISVFRPKNSTRVQCFAVNSDNLEEYYYAKKNTVYFQTENGGNVQLKGMKNHVNSLCCNNNIVVAGGFGELQMWNNHSPSKTFYNSSMFGFKTNVITNLCINEETLVATTLSSKTSEMLSFDLQNDCSIKSKLKFHDLNISSLCQESESKSIWLGTNKGSIFMIDPRNENESFLMKNKTDSSVNCTDCTQSNRNHYILSGQNDGTLCVWDIRNTQHPFWTEKHPFKSITSVRFTDIGNCFAFVTKGINSHTFIVQSLYNLMKNEAPFFFKEEKNLVCHDIYSKEEKLLALCTFRKED